MLICPSCFKLDAFRLAMHIYSSKFSLAVNNYLLVKISLFSLLHIVFLLQRYAFLSIVTFHPHSVYILGISLFFCSHIFLRFISLFFFSFFASIVFSLLNFFFALRYFFVIFCYFFSFFYFHTNFKKLFFPFYNCHFFLSPYTF